MDRLKTALASAEFRQSEAKQEFHRCLNMGDVFGRRLSESKEAEAVADIRALKRSIAIVEACAE